MSIKKKVALLKKLTKNEMIEICKNYGIKGYSGLSQAKLAEHLAKNCDLSLEELENLVNSFIEQKLIGKIYSAKDHFLLGKVKIEYFDDELIIGDVSGYKVRIKNLGKDDFEYSCDERCNDYMYVVKRGKTPFCKHYPAVLAELIYQKKLDPDEIKLNLLSEEMINALLTVVAERMLEEGAIDSKIDELKNLKEEMAKDIIEDYVEISRQNRKTAIEKYEADPESLFESLTEDVFKLLEFDTIRRYKGSQTWDLLVIGTHATPPYIAVVECKTAASGVYDQLIRNPDYMIRLKNYCVDMVRERLIGIYKDYVRYMLLVAPDFPREIERFSSQFRHLTGGIRMTFLPSETLVYLIKRYRENPIITHDMLAKLFDSERIIRKEDIDRLFEDAERYINNLTELAKKKLRDKFEDVASRTADACFIKMDEILLQGLINDLLKVLQPDLVKIGVKSTTGITTILLKHDYFKIWEKVLDGLINEFIKLLREESEVQQKKTELKEELSKFLELR